MILFFHVTSILMFSKLDLKLSMTLFRLSLLGKFSIVFPAEEHLGGVSRKAPRIAGSMKQLVSND